MFQSVIVPKLSIVSDRRAERERRPFRRSRFEEDVDRVVGGLQQALTALVSSVPGPPRRATELQRQLKIGTEQSWQVFRTVKASDPFEAALYVPKRGSIEKVLKAARLRELPAEVVSTVAEQFDEFERLIDRHAQDRETFEQMLSRWSAPARTKADLAAGKAIFSGMSHVRGVCSEVCIVSHLMHPSTGDQPHDKATLRGELGLRRLRPGVFVANTTTTARREEIPIVSTLDGQPIDGPQNTLLPMFCSTPTPQFKVSSSGDVVEHRLIGDEVGLTDTVDFVDADVMRAIMPRSARRSKDTLAISGLIAIPTRRFLQDVLIHRDVLQDIEPRLVAYDTTETGLIDIRRPGLLKDPLELFQGLIPLGYGLASFRAPGIPRYVDMIQHVCQKLGWNPDDLRGYRLDIEYPIYGAQYIIAFDLLDPSQPA